MAWLYVQGLGEWNSGFELLSEDHIELFVTSSEKPGPQRISWEGWKTRQWIKRLFGTILQPSTAARGVESWISSLRDSRANLGVSPENGRGQQTRGGSGQKLKGSFAKWDRRSSFWKTLSVSAGAGSPEFSETWPLSGSMRNGTCFLLPKSERTTFGGGSFFWPTPVASDCKKGVMEWDGKRGRGLLGAARGYMWPTPQTVDAQKGRAPRLKSDRASRNPKKMSSYRMDLKDAVHLLPTPRATCRDMGTMKMQRFSGTDKRKGKAGSEYDPTNGGMLNPPWVEWLMGFPIGWTDSEPLETELFHLWLHSHLRALMRESPASRGSEPHLKGVTTLSRRG